MPGLFLDKAVAAAATHTHNPRAATRIAKTTSSSLKVFGLAQNVVKKLQQLNSSFFTVIYQEGIKCFQKEEPSGMYKA